MTDQQRYMGAALEEARAALAQEEVPVGAVVVCDGQIVGRGRNCREGKKDPTCHAEIMAIRDAAAHLGGWRLHRCQMYVTLEPCPMCAGAIVQARVGKLVIGTMDPKAGACGSLMNLLQDKRLNHQVEIEAGILEEECRSVLQEFFTALREKRKKT